MDTIITHEYYIIFRVAAGMALAVYLGAALLYWLKILYFEESIENYYKLLRNCSVVICVFQGLYLFVDLFNNIQKLEAQGVLVSTWKYIFLNLYPLIIPLVILSLILHCLYSYSQEKRNYLYKKFSHNGIWVFLATVPASLLIVQSLFWPHLVDAVYWGEPGKDILMNMQGAFFVREISIYVCLDVFMDFAINGFFWSKNNN